MSYNEQPQQRLYSTVFLCMGFYNQATIIYTHLQASFFCVLCSSEQFGDRG